MQARQDNTILYLAFAGIAMAFFLGRKKKPQTVTERAGSWIKDVFSFPDSKPEGGVMGTNNPNSYEQPDAEVKGIALALYNYMDDVQMYVSDRNEEDIFAIVRNIKGPNSAVGVASYFGEINRSFYEYYPFEGNLSQCLNALSEPAKDKIRPYFYGKLIF